MGVFEETFNPMWVFDGYSYGSLPEFVNPDTIDVISAPGENGIGSSLEWSLEKMGIKGAFGILVNYLSSLDQKARERIVVNEFLKYVEVHKEKDICSSIALVSECCFDMIVLSYLVAMNRVYSKNKTIRADYSAFAKGMLKWIKGLLKDENDNNLLCRVGEEKQNNYAFVNSVLFRRSYALLTNCFAVGKFISEEEYKLLCHKYIFESRSDYLKIEAPSEHPVFNEMSLSHIARITIKEEFARQVVEYYEQKYSDYHWMIKISQSQMSFFAENRLYREDYLV